MVGYWETAGKGGVILSFESKKLSGKKQIVDFTGAKIESLSDELIEYIASDVLATK